MSLNPCMFDRDACLPIEDFEVNCTCILTSKEPIEATEDIFMFFMGHEFPFYLFKQAEPANPGFSSLAFIAGHARDHLQGIAFVGGARNLRFEENMALFLANSTMCPKILRHLKNENYIRTSDLRENSAKWCAEGECEAFVHTEELFNKSSGKQLSIKPLVRHQLCQHKCKRFYWNEGILCRQKCVQNIRYDQVAVIGTLKRQFGDFVRVSVVHNFREKYAKYLSVRL
ncbi:unnamed protein product [Angiostrongylus costaricensis]|uniref:Recep_L_domain domain-containing protein n=1 Tax=Angiostrongylus costaricensis TaxID=334426 RepID=A0A0R3PKG5_ANGCS|nr:unnamed protein product [Angiostrongylus costaricensis]